MSASTIDQGKSWVMDVFEQAREQYRETVPIDTIFPWQEGPPEADRRADQGTPGAGTYALAFTVRHETHAIPFTAHELTACTDPDNSEARLATKKKILDTFTALESP